MFKDKVGELNKKIKSLDKLSSEDLRLLVEEADTILSAHESEFMDELMKRKIFNKIRFIHRHLANDLEKIQGFELKEKHILFLDENNKPRKIKNKKVSELMELYFFITPADDLFNLLGLYFYQPDNFFILHLYDQKT